MSALKNVGKAAMAPLWKRFRWRIEDVSGRRFDPQLEELRRAVESLRGELREVRDELRGHADHRADKLDGDFRWHDDELRRLSAHVAATDSRVAALERHPGAEKTPTPDADELRAEHARLRARTSAVAQYEERLSRLEEALPRAKD